LLLLAFAAFDCLRPHFFWGRGKVFCSELLIEHFSLTLLYTWVCLWVGEKIALLIIILLTISKGKHFVGFHRKGIVDVFFFCALSIDFSLLFSIDYSSPTTTTEFVALCFCVTYFSIPFDSPTVDISFLSCFLSFAISHIECDKGGIACCYRLSIDNNALHFINFSQ
jgi:hypothetical protein